MEQNPLNQKVPPYSEDAESAVLGALLINFSLDVLDTVRAYIGKGDFFIPSHQNIFQAIEFLEKKGSGIDYLTVIEELKSQGLLEKSGGVSYVTSLVASVPTTANIEYYSKIVQESSIRRRLLAISSDLQVQAHNKGRETSEILEELERHIFELNDQRTLDSTKKVAELVKTAMDIIEERIKNKRSCTGIPSGFPELDDMTSGFQNSEMIVIGARPSMGKTAFAMTMAANMAIHKGIKCGFFTLEMSHQSVMERLIAQEGNINSRIIKNGLGKSQDLGRMMDVVGDIFEAPLWINDTPNMKLLDLRAEARRMVSKWGVQIIFIDYLGLITFEDKRIPRHEQMAEVSRSLKALARELKIPVIALSQVGRQVEGKEPALSDLRESGAIEQDADMVLFLHRDRKIEDDKEPLRNIETKLIMAKNRNGPIGYVNLMFMPHVTKFVSQSR